MLEIYSYRETISDGNGNETTQFTSAADAKFTPVARGATADLPTLDSTISAYYHDTDLDVLKFWNGTTWQTITKS